MPEKLKPCPFCGKEPITKVKVIMGMGTFEIRYLVECEYCCICKKSDTSNCDSFDKAQSAMNKTIEDWNRRVENAEIH